MSELKLIENVHTIFTADPEGQELRDGYVLVEDNEIEELGNSPYKGPEPDLAIDGEDKVMIPGLINTHHHLFQTLFRNFKEVNNAKLFTWLTELYDRWAKVDRRAIHVSTAIGAAELLLSGATTTSDHLYLFPEGKNDIFDVEVEAAKEVGIRFHPCRGSMSLSREDGGLPPKEVVQTEEEIIREYRRVIEEYHDRDKFAMTKIALAPCSPFSVTDEIMRKTAELAEKEDMALHTHLAETEDETEFCLDEVGMRPVDYMEELSWLDDRVWFAHAVHVNEREIEKLSEAGVGMSHCPSSNMRLGSGIAPVVKMKDTDIKVSMAVDGSASNDTSNMIKELRQALLLQRVKYGADSITPREVLQFGTIGGARALGREDELGSIEPGKAADLVMVDLNRLEYAGGLSDPVSALLMCDTKGVDFNMVDGEVLVEDGELCDQELLDYVDEQNEIAARFYS
ncbi:MAG: 8-oxoguanine deaminase [Candidatus Bipolaricaulota bacterium]|nr:8-oxoguanine deaminase [Candidatus Bipolaricaulota bacterium]MBS3791851.1 8-oxoguanine deaminase [Candidatus Bipolaricaulota bacterium]